ncbi:dipeptidase [Pseudoalteromonas carrageenovora]|uniref:dipeptidase n=1 Tax=Pseudoalteromonas carrageenovora TaxID=227 RepID=UPI0026E3C111|nr:dipeptidase [Pseudoalteromonas carrageenovora]MDO6465880.1 dipeptidase [Pseudoalteromonas carrageenovora]
MKKLALASALLFAFSAHAQLHKNIDSVADYAVNTYQNAQVHTLTNLVAFPTVNKDSIPAPQNPDFINFKSVLKMKAAELGFDYQDLGYTVLIGMGKQADKVTVVTHGDVQPANASKWKQSPFIIDTSEPGKLVGRGTEDDKGAIATALYAMKAIKDKGIELDNRMELMIYLAEESDWGPLTEFMKTYEQPKYAVTIDASYPVVVAEKGWSLIAPTFNATSKQTGVYVSDVAGGAFKSQIPEDASLVLHNASESLVDSLKAKAKTLSDVEFSFKEQGEGLKITVKGMSAHSSEPESGVNAIAHLSELFKDVALESNSDGQLIKFVNQLIGLDIHGKQFGDIAYEHEFMGPMSVAPTVIERNGNALTLAINARRPVGKDESVLKQQINSAINEWETANNVTLTKVETIIGTPMLLDNAPHAQKLLDIFKHFTGDEQADFVSIGGGTNAKLFDNAVSFGPSMPGKRYTGHSEHEFITLEQLELNLRMYTAMMIELGNM